MLPVIRMHDAPLRDGCNNDIRPKKRTHKTVDRGDTPPRVHKFIKAVTEAPGFKKGAFSAKARIHQMPTMKFAQHVVENPGSYDEETRKQAQLAINMQKRRKE